MSQIKDFQSKTSRQFKGLSTYATDLIKWSAGKQFAIVGDIAGFAGAQLKRTREASSLDDYRAGFKKALSGLGNQLKAHRQEVEARVKAVPTQLRSVIADETTAPAAKKARKPSAGKKKSTRKASARKPATAKKAARKAARKAA